MKRQREEDTFSDGYKVLRGGICQINLYQRNGSYECPCCFESQKDKKQIDDHFKSCKLRNNKDLFPKFQDLTKIRFKLIPEKSFRRLSKNAKKRKIFGEALILSDSSSGVSFYTQGLNDLIQTSDDLLSLSENLNLNTPITEKNQTLRDENLKLQKKINELKEKYNDLKDEKETETNLLKKQLAEAKEKTEFQVIELNKYKNMNAEEFLKHFNPTLNDYQLDYLCQLIIPNKLSKLRHSVLLSWGSKTDQLNYFQKGNISYSPKFLSEPETYSIVRVLLEVQQNVMNKLRLIIIHYDNNDVKTPYAEFDSLYLVTTSYCVYFANNVDNYDFPKLKEKRKLPNLDSLAGIASNLYEFTKEETKLLCEERNVLLGVVEPQENCSYEKFHEFLSESAGQKKRDHAYKVEVENKDSNNFNIIKQKFMEFIENERMVMLESSILPTKSYDDMIVHMNRMKQQFPESLIIFTGDQPVYSSQRSNISGNAIGAFMGKFHMKLTFLRGLFNKYYDNLISPIQKMFTLKKKKTLKTVPQGYFKLCNRLFLNVYYLMWISFYSCFLKKRKEKNYESLTVAQFIRLNEQIDGFHIPELVLFCCHTGFSYFLLIKSIKLQNWSLYILSLKIFLRWCRSTGKSSNKNVGHANYFRIIVQHLFDIKYVYSQELIKFLKDHMTYTFNGNNISYDEMTEIQNGVAKKGAKSKNPGKQLVNFTKISNIVKFVKNINKKRLSYTRRTCIPDLIFVNPIQNGFKNSNGKFASPNFAERQV